MVGCGWRHLLLRLQGHWMLDAAGPGAASCRPVPPASPPTAAAADRTARASHPQAHLRWRAAEGADSVLTDFHFPERDAFMALYPQGYHKADKQVGGAWGLGPGPGAHGQAEVVVSQ